jgi:hypothetical protein
VGGRKGKLWRGRRPPLTGKGRNPSKEYGGKGRKEGEGKE